MKIRCLVLITAALTVVSTSVIMYQPEASIRDAYETACPVEVPYLDLTINQYKEQRRYAETYRTESDVTDGDHKEAGEYGKEAGQNPDINDDRTGSSLAGENTGAMEAGEDRESLPELVEPESDESVGGGAENPVLTYLGEWTTTAYCPCEICCGQWATGCTASGVMATPDHTVACGILPFGTKVMIDGIVYTVEDLGVDGEWIDIFFASHEEALKYGMQQKEVYLWDEN